MYEFKKIFKRNHRIVCLLLSCFLSFGTVATEYLTVQAFDWVAPNVYLPFAPAIPYLMGLLGVAPSNDDSINWDSWRDDYEEYALSGGLSNEALQEWIEDVSNGRLNQASECWTKFKEFIYNKVIGTNNISNIISSVVGSSVSIDSQYNLPFESALFRYNVLNGSYYFMFFSEGYSNRYTSSSSSNTLYFTRSNTDAYYLSFNYNGSELTSSNVQYTNTSIVFTSDYVGYFYNLDNLISVSDTFHLWDISNNDFVYDSSIINNLSLVLSNAISSAIPDVIPLPWDQIGDTVDEISDTIDGLIEQVNTGVISISAYMQAILDLVGAIAVDTTTELVYPQNPDKPDETIDDKVNENKDNMGFTLLGLEKVFPFCIPFDIYAFMTLLVAEPVAPVINWPVYNPITQQNEIITIDFSSWNSVVVLFRYIFDFLFIIGLLLMARALIGGGDSA